MDEAVLDDIVMVLPPLLATLDALGFVARYFDPPDFAEVMAAAGTPDAALRVAWERMGAWPEGLSGVRAQMDGAVVAVLAGFDGLRAADQAADGVRAAFRALRFLPRAQEALYPLAAGLPAVGRYFLPADRREDAGLLAGLGGAAVGTGVQHVANERGSRGGFSVYVPENYTTDQAWPLVMALHGGGGNGRDFLWSWLRDARAEGAILVTPTAMGPTWALMGEDVDTPNLRRILAAVCGEFVIDPARMLLTGMSDGGTFCYVSGLEPASPFTHLAPVSASFHPMLAEMADPGRLRGLPIHIVHGALDWMFAVEVARGAAAALRRAGAAVMYREIEDLSHCYPREANRAVLQWLGDTLVSPAG